jgi:GNAT superfamily N-acetyltransferase
MVLPEPIVIRPAIQLDVDAMVAERTRDEGQQSELRRRMTGYLAGTYSPREALDDRAVFTAEVSGVFAGYIAGHRSTRWGCSGELQWLNVVAEFQSRGVADQLFLALADWYSSAGITSVCVNVGEDNTRARSFYIRHGATRLHEHWMHWMQIGR